MPNMPHFTKNHILHTYYEFLLIIKYNNLSNYYFIYFNYMKDIQTSIDQINILPPLSVPWPARYP